MTEAIRVCRVIRAVGGLYTLVDETGELFLAKPRGIFRKDRFLVLPGDRAEITDSGDVDIPWVIERVLTRKNVLIRPAMANLDFLFIVMAQSRPEPDFFLLDKMLSYAGSKSITCCLVLTKTDISLEETEEKRLNLEIQAYQKAGFELLQSSSDELGLSIQTYVNEKLEKQVWAFSGQSGVGKSTLVNALLGEDYMDTGKLSERLGRGKHTTRHVELIPFFNGFMVDTPGFSALEVDALALKTADLDYAYPDFARLRANCRFADCTHRAEPDCALKELIESSPCQKGRFERYAILFEQITKACDSRREGKK